MPSKKSRVTAGMFVLMVNTPWRHTLRPVSLWAMCLFNANTLASPWALCCFYVMQTAQMPSERQLRSAVFHSRQWLRPQPIWVTCLELEPFWRSGIQHSVFPSPTCNQQAAPCGFQWRPVQRSKNLSLESHVVPLIPDWSATQLCAWEPAEWPALNKALNGMSHGCQAGAGLAKSLWCFDIMNRGEASSKT